MLTRPQFFQVLHPLSRLHDINNHQQRIFGSLSSFSTKNIDTKHYRLGYQTSQETPIQYRRQLQLKAADKSHKHIPCST